MKKGLTVAAVSAVTLSLLLAGCGGGDKKDSAKKVDYPTKNITMICPWGAGGGTDAVLRALCKAAEKETKGKTITVSNVTGGGGATGHAAIMKAKPDGYTIGMITFELNSMPPQKLAPFTYKDFDPVIRVNTDAAALTTLPGIGAGKAEEIIRYRERNGRFKRPEDLMKVPGIKEKAYERVKDSITV